VHHLWCRPLARAVWLHHRGARFHLGDLRALISKQLHSVNHHLPVSSRSRAGVAFPPKIDRVSWGGPGDKISEGTDGLHSSLPRTFPWPGVESGTITSPAYGAGPRPFGIGRSANVLYLPVSRCRVGPGINPPCRIPWPSSLSVSLRPFGLPIPLLFLYQEIDGPCYCCGK